MAPGNSSLTSVDFSSLVGSSDNATSIIDQVYTLNNCTSGVAVVNSSVDQFINVDFKDSYTTI